jgi:hypothetical protein
MYSEAMACLHRNEVLVVGEGNSTCVQAGRVVLQVGAILMQAGFAYMRHNMITAAGRQLS